MMPKKGRMLSNTSSSDITECRRKESALNEGVKELRCLYGIASIAEKTQTIASLVHSAR